MGAEQSSSRGGNTQNNGGLVMKTCYYELLSVDRQASDDEIKKAYRKKALELHPDRNYGDAENATKKFAEVQTAYEVLSDPQERSWYDSHRSSILGGGEAAEEHFEENIRMTSATQIMNLIGKFDSSVPFTDAPNGFFGILQETFAALANEETVAFTVDLDVVDYPEFGSSEDSYEDVAKPFYRVWGNFSTRKSFSWKDVYRASDAPDRATRRLIEKENKGFRDQAKAEFNDAVRHLVMFVRKRDPRYTPNSQSEDQRQKALRDAASAQAARSRAARAAKLANLDSHVTPDWQKPDETQEEIDDDDSSEESEIEQIECVVCRKIFKSDKQYDVHAKSKKHIKAVQQIQKQMRKENKSFELDTPEPNTPTDDLEKLDLDAVPEEEQNADKSAEEDTGVDIDAKIEKEPNYKFSEKSDGSDKDSDAGEVDDDYAPRETIENRLVGASLSQEQGIEATESCPEEEPAPSKSIPQSSNGSQKKPLGKAKAKRVKKAAQKGVAEQETQEFECVTCHDSFTSKTKLFNHIKEYDHAQPVAKAGNVKKKKK